LLNSVLVIGAKNSGKSSFISFLRHTLALPAHKQQTADAPEPQTATSTSFTSHYLETETDGERVGLTIWDSVGLEKNIVDLQLREMTAFVEAKFEDTFVEEQKVMRSPGVRDTHIHCVFLILDPVRLDTTITASLAGGSGGKSANGSLDNDLDLQVMRSLWGKTTVIPVIAKADTLTTGHMAYLKRAVWQSLKKSKLDPLEALELEGDEEDDSEEDVDSDVEGEAADIVPSLTAPVSSAKKSHKRQSSLSALTLDDDIPYLPMSILSPDAYDLPPYARANPTQPPGRRFPWGFADPNNSDHCDFGRLRDSIFSEWRSDLRELSRAKWYENWRTSRLKKVPSATPAARSSAVAATTSSDDLTRRARGGVTPVTSVPREARGVPSPAATASPHPPPSGPPPPLPLPSTPLQQQQQQQTPLPKSSSASLSASAAGSPAAGQYATFSSPAPQHAPPPPPPAGDAVPRSANVAAVPVVQASTSTATQQQQGAGQAV
jgi:septin family protein